MWSIQLDPKAGIEARPTTNKTKGQPTEGEKILANNSSDEGLI